MPQCKDCNNTNSAIDTFQTFDRMKLIELSNLAESRLAKVSAFSLPVKASLETTDNNYSKSTLYHLSSNGDLLVTSSFVDNLAGDVVVRGEIASFPYELHLRSSIEKALISVTIHMTKPIEVGPYTFKYALGGINQDASGKIISASSIYPVVDNVAMKLDWFCALKCGGAVILPTLVSCLPAFATGPAGYISCVTTKLGTSDGASVALCIARKCL